MNILIVDRDEFSAELLEAKLVDMGHHVVREDNKNKVVQRVSGDVFDIIFLDPTPLKSIKPLVLDIRKHISAYPYMFLMSENVDASSAVKDGVHDFLAKPFQVDILQDKIDNAERFLRMVQNLGYEGTDFPSAGGVISKSAFYQLFLSSLDRASRYGEKSYVLLISVHNYKELSEMDGAYGADYVVAKLSQHLVLNRRQSDIIGQTRKNEYALLLQRPDYDSEPADAAKRLVQSLAEARFMKGESIGPAQFLIRLVELPVCSKITEHVVTMDRQ